MRNALDKWFKYVERMENEIILYTDENDKTNVSVRFADEDVWVTAVQLAEIPLQPRCNYRNWLSCSI